MSRDGFPRSSGVGAAEAAASVASAFGRPAPGQGDLVERLQAQGLSEFDARATASRVKHGEPLREALSMTRVFSVGSWFDVDRIAEALDPGAGAGSGDGQDHGLTRLAEQTGLPAAVAEACLELLDEIVDARVALGSSREMARTFANSAARSARESVIRRGAPFEEVTDLLRRTRDRVRRELAESRPARSKGKGSTRVAIDEVVRPGRWQR